MLPPQSPKPTFLVVFLVFLQMQILEEIWYVSVNCMTCFFGCKDAADSAGQSARFRRLCTLKQVFVCRRDIRLLTKLRCLMDMTQHRSRTFCLHCTYHSEKLSYI